MAVINVQNWSVEQVVDWITGFDSTLSLYASQFASSGITGQKLLTLMSGDLDYLLGVKRIGDQLILHDAIQTLRDELATPWTTLQTLSLSLSVRCKNYRSELTQQKQKFQDKKPDSETNHHHHHHGHHGHHHQHHHHHHEFGGKGVQGGNERSGSGAERQGGSGKGGGGSGASSGGGSGSSNAGGSKRLETIPTTSLASASYLLDAGKVLIRWLTRFPFLGKLNYDEISRKLTKHCFELAMLSQRDTFADNAIEEVQYLCTKIIELCEVLINSNDSLVIQPAGIDIITLRKRSEQDWGLQFESSYWGLHQITGVKLSSPAQQSGHLERGDEILQVNYQTVLAWPQTSVIGLLHENENEVILTVKRRPRHASTNLLLLGGHQNNMYLNKIPNRKSFFERRAREKERDSERIRGINLLTLTGVEEASEEVVMREEVAPKDTKVSELVSTTKDTPDGEQNGGKEQDVHIASDARFWKLYPKPKYLIKRRATVTGASPTDTRPPVTFINDTSTDSSSPATNHRSDPTSSIDGLREGGGGFHTKAHQQVHHRRSTPVTTMTNEPTPIMQLLNPPLVSRPPLDKSRSAPEEDTGNERDEQQQMPSAKSRVVEPPPVATTKPENEDEDDEDVFVKGQSSSNSVAAVVSVVPPTPKPRLSRTSASDVKDTSVFGSLASASPVPAPRVSESEEGVSSETCSTFLSKSTSPPALPARRPEPPKNVRTDQPPPIPSRPDPPKPALPPPSKQPPPELAPKRPPSPPTILHRGILHIRSQLRKQSSSNSASALPVLGNSSSTSSIPSALMICSSSPRWIRQNAVFYSNRELEILTPVARSCSVSCSNPGSGGIGGGPSFKVNIAQDSGNMRKHEFSVMTASEVHSRPFAFKITNPDSITYYLAAESQVELDQWVGLMTTGILRGGVGGIPPSHGSSSSALHRLLGSTGLSSVGDSGRRNFTRAPYKRSISLGSQSPTVSYTNLHTTQQPACTPPPPAQNTPPTSSQSPRLYGSSTNLCSTPPSRAYVHHRLSSTCSASPGRDLNHHHHHHHHPHYHNHNDTSSPSRSLNRSKSSSLKTDWFLRNSSSNISSITITSKKVTKSQVTQVPTPNSTPTKTAAHHPMMGVAIKTQKKNSSSGSGSASTSPTRKYMCPNCCNVTKVDMGTQTSVGESDNNDGVKSPSAASQELKLVFFNEESRV